MPESTDHNGHTDDVLLDLQAVNRARRSRQEVADRRQVDRMLWLYGQCIATQIQEAQKLKYDTAVTYWEEVEASRQRALQALKEGRLETARVFVDSFRPRMLWFWGFGTPATTESIMKAAVLLACIAAILVLIGAPLLWSLVILVGLPRLAHYWSRDALKLPPEIPLIDPGPWGWDDQ
jgi:hypothetical protein